MPRVYGHDPRYCMSLRVPLETYQWIREQSEAAGLPPASYTLKGLWRSPAKGLGGWVRFSIGLAGEGNVGLLADRPRSHAQYRSMLSHSSPSNSQSW